MAETAHLQPDQKIKIRIPTALRQYTGGQKDFIVLYRPEMTVGDALSYLVHKNPDIEKHLLSGDLEFDKETGEPLGVQMRNFVVVYVDDEDIRYTGRGKTPIEPNCLVAISASIAGG